MNLPTPQPDFDPIGVAHDNWKDFMHILNLKLNAEIHGYSCFETIEDFLQFKYGWDENLEAELLNGIERETTEIDS